jgi:hypothetical protein
MIDEGKCSPNAERGYGPNTEMPHEAASHRIYDSSMFTLMMVRPAAQDQWFVILQFEIKSVSHRCADKSAIRSLLVQIWFSAIAL